MDTVHEMTIPEAPGPTIPAAETTRPTQSWIAGVALAAIFWTLVLSGGFSLGSFFARAAADPNSAASELDQLACVEAEVAKLTVPGEAVRLVVEPDPYVTQRVIEVIFPRVDIVTDPAAPTLSVTAGPDVPTGAPRCGALEITVSRVP